MSGTAAASASSVLVVRPSSLGDIVYALAVVSDIRRAHPDLAVDWVAEPGFAPLIALCPDVGRVIPFGLRRWRRAPFTASTWRDVDAFRDALRKTRYAAILDLQEQVKGALIARAARGVRHGFDRSSIREPLATLFDDIHHRVSRDLHFVTRCRKLAGAALDYPTAALEPARAGARARHARRAVRRRAARDEPRRQAVAGGALARGDECLRRRRLRHRAALGKRCGGSAQPPARGRQREGRAPRVAVAAGRRNAAGER